jgi:uncharacterized protein
MGLIFSGSLCVVIGVIGIFLPVLPTTPFLLLASACYIRSSNNLYRWLLNNKYLGKYIRDYDLKKGMPLKAKVTTIIIASVAIIISSLFIEEIFWKYILYLLGIIMFIVIILIKTAKE